MGGFALRTVAMLSLGAIGLLAISLPVAIWSVARAGWHPYGLVGIAVMGVALAGVLRGGKIPRLLEIVKGHSVE